tara:strand:- start:408 stop:809 length:402 start_codon:yes stop_codon:yes gene_type:complete
MNKEKRIDRDRGTSPAVLRSSGPKQRPEKVATKLGVSGESARRSVSTDDMKPMTLQEEYRNADVPMPNDLLHASNTEEFKNDKSVFEDKTVGNDYKSGGAYRAMMKLFADNLEDEKFIKHCKKFFKGENDKKN